jgi:hypothetical protein
VSLSTCQIIYTIIITKRIKKRQMKEEIGQLILWVSDCCLTSTEQFFSYIMVRTS